MKTVCVYHSVDLDGWMSAAIVKHWFNNQDNHKCNTCVKYHINSCEHCVKYNQYKENIDFIGYNYGQPIPDLSEYDKVVMCDISFPPEIMRGLYDKLQTGTTEFENFIWIDHHISAIKALHEHLSISELMPAGLRDTKFAACELTWKYFFPNEPMPEIVRLLGRYDCFGHKGTNEEQKVLEFQYGARQCISNYEEAYKALYYNIDPINGVHLTYSIANIERSGRHIYSYLCTEAKQSYKNGFEIKFRTNLTEEFYRLSIVKFICINKERFNPINFGIDYHKDGYDGAACFWYSNGKWNFSLYNDNGLVDCSIIAKQYGGGGHKGASGFVIDDINRIINNKI